MSSRMRTGRVHSHHAGCGHSHLPDEGGLRAAEGWRTRLAVALAMGLRPCSGAVLVLLFAKVLGVNLWGGLSARVVCRRAKCADQRRQALWLITVITLGA